MEHLRDDLTQIQQRSERSTHRADGLFIVESSSAEDPVAAVLDPSIERDEEEDDQDGEQDWIYLLCLIAEHGSENCGTHDSLSRKVGDRHCGRNENVADGAFDLYIEI